MSELLNFASCGEAITFQRLDGTLVKIPPQDEGPILLMNACRDVSFQDTYGEDGQIPTKVVMSDEALRFDPTTVPKGLQPHCYLLVSREVALYLRSYRGACEMKKLTGLSPLSYEVFAPDNSPMATVVDGDGEVLYYKGLLRYEMYWGYDI